MNTREEIEEQSRSDRITRMVLAIGAASFAGIALSLMIDLVSLHRWRDIWWMTVLPLGIVTGGLEIYLNLTPVGLARRTFSAFVVGSLAAIPVVMLLHRPVGIAFWLGLLPVSISYVFLIIRQFVPVIPVDWGLKVGGIGYTIILLLLILLTLQV
ncbi:MAG: hypothetical protein D6675_13900 [Gemmatimonadetes bacterium]|nr:MAG: hypothetical protein D6675_13900 [Gemmatimonadota bacterium]